MTVVGISIKTNTNTMQTLKLNNTPSWQQVLLKLVVYCGADGTVYSDKLHNF
jgi:hypothetical protein